MRSRGMRAGAAATALCAVLALSACDGADGTAAEPTASPSGPGSTAASPDSPSSPTRTSTPAVPDNAVAPPGPLTDRLYRPDMLIFAKERLSDDMVRRIRRLPQVAAVEPIGLGNVTIENHALTIAAVDGASYRRFTPRKTAQFQPVWNRVAGGELAIEPRLGHKLEDADGNITLGSGSDAPTLHIGAYAPQATTIDMVVNKRWVDDIGRMVFGNGLLISTDEVDPSVIRKPIRRIVGKQASVQDLYIAARLGLDPNVKQTAFLTGGSIASVVGTFSYRVLGGGRIAPDPSWVSTHITSETVPILGDVTCHRALFPQLKAALQEVVSEGLADEIHPDEYAGCYHPRFIAGTTTLSNHSFGLALDLNVPGNQRGTVGEMNRRVVEIFKEWGFAWGGDWRYTDPMHFELAQVVEPR